MNEIRRATDDRTRAYYAETLPNPKLTVFPIAEVAAIGRSFGIPLVMDNTAAPILARPFAHGAAVVVYSTTKYLAIGCLIVDGGNFDWAAHATRQPALSTPDPSYYGAVWTERLSRSCRSPISSRPVSRFCEISAPRYRRSMRF